jgi:hypothetical protein
MAVILVEFAEDNLQPFYRWENGSSYAFFILRYETTHQKE